MSETYNITHNSNSSTLEEGRKVSSSPRIIISGGGTGGHIFPAIAIANSLKEINNKIEILFVGAQDKMEMEKIPAAGYKIIGLPVAGFQRKLIWKNFLVIKKLLKSLSEANRIVKEFKPNVIVGVGGYASGPILWAASRKQIPVVIQEQNSYAGITNKLLAKKASKIFVAYDGMEKYFSKEKIILAGNPVRQGLENVTSKREEALKYFQLYPGLKTILCLGGSLGARTINQSISNNLNLFRDSNAQLIWQSGSYYYADAKKTLESYNNNNIRLHDFISRMDLAYGAADLVISRAGAITISELCIVGKPVIIVPSPNVAEDHQTKNAMNLVSKNAAIMIKDNEAREKLVTEALNLLADDSKCALLSENIKKLALIDSAQVIAREILKLVD
jgi:UDP-N-acetylglucosamine--N-acetylmuramyl-(pentapeptide) pyrophosphoryl-undecaprenol N-acetylglucosamine transferase